MAEAIVEGLEVIDVDHQEQDLVTFGEPALEGLVEMPAIGDARQHVGEREVAQSLAAAFRPVARFCAS